jgi:hypothetical protein
MGTKRVSDCSPMQMRHDALADNVAPCTRLPSSGIASLSSKYPQRVQTRLSQLYTFARIGFCLHIHV